VNAIQALSSFPGDLAESPQQRVANVALGGNRDRRRPGVVVHDGPGYHVARGLAF